MNNNQAIKEITTTILNPEIDYLQLSKALTELQSIFSTLSEVDFNKPEMEATVHLPSGVAIAPKWASRCLDDMIRTKRFITGIYKAILSKQKENPNRPITVLYTGTGPFATLLMPLTTIFSPAELQLILIEVNLHSVESLKRVITKMDAESYVHSIHNCDASIFKLPKNTEADILVVECLQHALAREPQVAICYNLLPQLNKDTILIPQEISLHIAAIDISGMNNSLLTNSNTPATDFMEKSDPVFTLNKDAILQDAHTFFKPGFSFAEHVVNFSEEQLKEKTALAILTDIHVYDSEKIKFRESGLTTSSMISNAVTGGKKTITTRYILSDDPYLLTSVN
ncbi:hypothetical protein G5B37_01470 [Rasiella rasia]|uniref:Phytanoyl-CoA dioxygenase n=1 Tax=Rasiella rasia TaxID=2744027 RepID=A0A6G6GIB1_9FLAO|nr:hypothetical protein [Rasiella rasia]QIE58282.1 hypothetical protein G5B37_01470 [Rasiella rasia]